MKILPYFWRSECNYRVLHNAQNSFHPTSLRDAFWKDWILPRTKKCPLDTFYTSVRTGAVLSNPNTKKIQATTNVVTGILVGVSGFELCYFGLFDIFRTFICANIPFCSKYSITSNYVFCSYPLKGFSKGKNKGKFLMGTCFLQNHVYTNKWNKYRGACEAGWEEVIKLRPFNLMRIMPP